MKKALIYPVVIMLMALSASNLSAEAKSHNKRAGLLLNLFYGMEYDENGYTCTDATLDTISGLKHSELCEMWYQATNSDNPQKYRTMLGFYIDSAIPAKIWEKLEPKVNSDIINLLSYHEELDSILKANTHATSGPDSFVKSWNECMTTIGKHTETASSQKPSAEITPLRICTVMHKIFEDDNWATYLVEVSYSLHGSLGCPSYADYISFNKHDWHILTPKEVFETYDEKQVAKQLNKEYAKAKRRNGYTPTSSFGNLSQDWDEGSGIAYIDNGLLIYYQPYVAGCGAEGQYNLIIKSPARKR